MDGRVDGVLILRDQGDPTLEDVLRRKFPCVLFFTRSLDGEVAFVDSDNYTGGRMATQHLLDLGHKRIGMVRGSLRSVASNDRFNGYRDAMEVSGLGVRDEHVCIMTTLTENPEGFIQMMQGPNAPTALFVWSDDDAFTAIRLLTEWGYRVPEDVSVVGFDSLDPCERFTPPLTSVRQPVCEMAREATLLLAKIARGEEVARKQLLYPLTLDVRASTAPPKEGHPLR
jgi:LacI family transcriptional regulator